MNCSPAVLVAISWYPGSQTGHSCRNTAQAIGRQLPSYFPPANSYLSTYYLQNPIGILTPRTQLQETPGSAVSSFPISEHSWRLESVLSHLVRKISYLRNCVGDGSRKNPSWAECQRARFTLAVNVGNLLNPPVPQFPNNSACSIVCYAGYISMDM